MFASELLRIHGHDRDVDERDDFGLEDAGNATRRRRDFRLMTGAPFLGSGAPVTAGFPIWLWYFHPSDPSSRLDLRGFDAMNPARMGDTRG
jgi:hypothetical protein